MSNAVESTSAGRLFVVSTPIGNLGDITFRAIEVLKAVSVVLAEDTRHSRHLLAHFGIATPLEAYHEHNEARATPRLLERLRAGLDLALISDAGTPLLSDPGARLVRACVDDGVVVVPIPGASALLGALVASGLEAERFTFLGFLPRKGRDRAELLDELNTQSHTCVLYEAPTRVAATLAEIAARGGRDREVVVARELTKQFEEFRRGTVGELAAYYTESPPRGEIVIMLAGRAPEALDEATLRDRARSLGATGMSARDVASALVRELGASRNVAYRVAQEEGRGVRGEE